VNGIGGILRVFPMQSPYVKTILGAFRRLLFAGRESGDTLCLSLVRFFK
jgi:hypothetical protein